MCKFCLVGHLKVGSVGRPEILIFSTLPTLPNGIYHLNTMIKFIAILPLSDSNYLWPPSHPIKLLHLIFNQSESDKPILSNPAVSDVWPVYVAHAKCWKMVLWLTKDFLDDPSGALTSQKPCLYIIKQSLLCYQYTCTFKSNQINYYWCENMIFFG